MNAGRTLTKDRNADSAEILVQIFKGLGGQDSHLVLSLPPNPTQSREALTSFPRPRLNRRKVGTLQKSILREDGLEFKGDRKTGRERDSKLQLALSGDKKVLGSLVASYMPHLYRVALRILHIPEEAEEALRDGLVQVVQHLRKFEGRSQFCTWLTRIVINAALMRLRRSRREIVIPIDQKTGREDLSLAQKISDPGPNPEEMYAQVEWLQILNRKLQGLTPELRSAVGLQAIKGMSTKEAAEALGIPERGLKSNLHRARLKLKGRQGCRSGNE
jgi:RNA polymerase sigma-70 factor (ECF subfamily)